MDLTPQPWLGCLVTYTYVHYSIIDHCFSSLYSARRTTRSTNDMVLLITLSDAEEKRFEWMGLRHRHKSPATRLKRLDSLALGSWLLAGMKHLVHLASTGLGGHLCEERLFPPG